MNRFMLALPLVLLACARSPEPPSPAPARAPATEGREELRLESVTFSSHGATLAGTLVRPSGDASAAVVFVHGSGRQERNLEWARRFAVQGIAALVYDKRGVGASEGTYEEAHSVGGPNISLLADDAVAALGALGVRQPGVPLGLAGISQAGWIVPLAAERTRLAAFLVLWSGPVCKVSEEDIYSKHTLDRDSQALPSYEEALRARKEPYVWPDFLGVDTDPNQSLEKLSVPGLWIFGGNDGSIPVELSVRRLDGLKSRGLPYEYVLVPGLGHNNMNETFSTATDWIRRVGSRGRDR